MSGYTKENLIQVRCAWIFLLHLICTAVLYCSSYPVPNEQQHRENVEKEPQLMNVFTIIQQYSKTIQTNLIIFSKLNHQERFLRTPLM